MAKKKDKYKLFLIKNIQRMWNEMGMKHESSFENLMQLSEIELFEVKMDVAYHYNKFKKDGGKNNI